MNEDDKNWTVEIRTTNGDGTLQTHRLFTNAATALEIAKDITDENAYLRTWFHYPSADKPLFSVRRRLVASVVLTPTSSENSDYHRKTPLP